MQLPDFISKAVEFFGFAQKKLDAIPDAIQAQSKINDLDGKLTQAQADLQTAKQTISRLEARVLQLDSDLKAANEATAVAKKQAEATKASVEKVASQKAAAITASQGQPPLTITVAENPAKTTQGMTITERCLAAKAAEQKKNDN